MITDTSERILKYITANKQARAHDLGKLLYISQVAVHKQLNKLVAQRKIQKVGKPPQVFYVPVEQKTISFTIDASILADSTIAYINAHYLYITPQGTMLYGTRGFTEWVQSIKEDTRLAPLSEEYVKAHKKAQEHRTSNRWIDATEKVKTTFQDSNIKKLLYADFYSLPKFGKTKLGQLVLYAKQSQNRELIDQVVAEVKPIIEQIMTVYHIDSVAFVPPSLPRRLQFMQEFNDKLSLRVPQIKFTKAYRGNVIVAQKTLSRLEERVDNARDTIFVNSNSSSTRVKNLLLIDDAVGSGATLQETAKKLTQLNVVQSSIIGFAIVGSMKGFEVIREV